MRANYLLTALLGLSLSSFAAQFGPEFPTHRYPTDQSFHLSYELGFYNTDANFVGSFQTEKLLKQADLKIFRHSILAEFQPNRNLSAGFDLDMDSISLSTPTNAQESKTGLGDQRFFIEYRFIDNPGSSLGAAVMIKFPGYSNPTYQNVANSNELQILTGDGQSDFTGLLTSEMWLSREVRLRLDMGATYRLDDFATEVPYFFSFGFVTPKLDLEMRLKGNVTLNDDKFAGDQSAIDVLRSTFANSNYALSRNPWILTVEPHVEFWFSTQWSFSFRYDYSIAGNSSPYYSAFAFGLTYRQAETRFKKKRSFQQVDISTDQEAGQFQGEKQQRAEEQKAVDPTPIREEPSPEKEEEFR